VQFCNWLSELEHLRPCYQEDGTIGWTPSPEGNGYRLPTEAQWEFACRAGTTTRFSFGDDPRQLGRYGWYWPFIVGKTAKPVANKLPNAFGLYDMHGNVSEWCHDSYFQGYYDESPRIDPQGPAPGDGRHSRRGGDWYCSWDCARSSFRRAAQPPVCHDFTVGFRVMRVATATSSTAKSDSGRSEQALSSATPVAAPEPAENVPGRVAPPLAQAPFDAKHARAHQEAWSRHLSAPVEQTNSIGMKLVLIPPGEFMMGSSREDIAAAVALAIELKLPPNDVLIPTGDDEMLRHRVTLSKPFAMGATEVTIGQFGRFVDATKYVTESEQRGGGVRYSEKEKRWLPPNPALNWRSPGYPVNDETAVVDVDWNDTIAFCNWLSGEEGLQPCYRQDAQEGWMLLPASDGYRLPTEAEWEYACRAGTTTLFSSGDDLTGLHENAWTWSEASRSVRAVGLKLPNSFGLYDMHGNLNEWCHDRYAADYYSKSPPLDPFGPLSGGQRVRRGGDWWIGSELASRSSSRACSPPQRVDNPRTTGFRVVRVATTTPVAAKTDGVRSTSRAQPDNGYQWPPGTAAPAIAPFDAEQARKHQDAWAKHLGVPVEQINFAGMKFVLIPPGEFMMGSSPAEIETVTRALISELPKLNRETVLTKLSIEVPKHRVTITGPFLIAVTELTIGQFRKYVKATGFVTDAERDGGGARVDFEGNGIWIVSDPGTTWRTPWYPATDEFPVSVVSWNDAVQFCNWLSGQEGLKPCYQADARDGWVLSPESVGYRLPTEAEWEFACRAGTTTQFSFGDDPRQMDRHGWCWPIIQKTAQPVAERLPNPFGLYDMHGNVAEWCNDWYVRCDYDGLPQIDPHGPPPAVGPHVYRGGDWYTAWDASRSSYRRAMRESNRHAFTVGFRVVRGLATVSKSN
jgi:formylglycine-generating enzyme required for sulfatase activity